MWGLQVQTGRFKQEPILSFHQRDIRKARGAEEENQLPFRMVEKETAIYYLVPEMPYGPLQQGPFLERRPRRFHG